MANKDYQKINHERTVLFAVEKPFSVKINNTRKRLYTDDASFHGTITLMSSLRISN